MDRETLETLCRSFAACQSTRLRSPVGEVDGSGAVRTTDPVPEIVRSFRLAEISAAEMQSLLGLVTDDADDAEAETFVGLTAPKALVEDFPDFDLILAAGFDSDDDDTLAGNPAAVIEVRLGPLDQGAGVSGQQRG